MLRDAKHVLTLITTFSAAVMDAQDPNMFGMSSVASSVMELLCCVPSETVCKFYEKHVFTLIITFSAAVMDAKGKNMF